LDWLRELIGVPFIVTSGFRCPKYNRQVRGSETSFHLTGEAADITVSRKSQLPWIYRVAIASSKFTEIGIKENSFIHFATGKKKPYYFIYLANGGYKSINPDILAKIQSETIEQHLREYKV
jgi:hypothetical protein